MNIAGELYLAYDFDKLLVREYRKTQSKPIVVEIYEFSSSADAFGIFTHDQDGNEVEIGQDGIYSADLLRFWRDRIFVRILAEQETDSSRQIVLSLGRQIASNISGTASRPQLVNSHPTQDQLQNSMRYFHTQVSLNIHYYLH